jgi:hypothetical protein
MFRHTLMNNSDEGVRQGSAQQHKAAMRGEDLWMPTRG